MASHVTIFALILVVCFVSPANSCPPSRRRRRCYRDCSVGSWSSWSWCSRTCGSYGTQSRTRSKVVSEACGGTCRYSLRETRACNRVCCPAHCSVSAWSSWSSCSGCGYSTQSSSRKILSYARCGGNSCPGTLKKSRSCYTGRCCPVNCVVGSWGSWGACSAACESTGQRTRTRPIRTSASCGGTGCPSRTDRKSCTGPCCPRNCVLSSWSTWTKCSSSSCGANSGTQARTRRITTRESCGGSCTQPTSGSRRCTPIPVTCQMSSWSSWKACVANNGRCGAGTQTRTRSITRPSYCSSPCPARSQSRSCTHSCCPVNCQLNSWGSWSACSTTCGQGTSVRSRTVRTAASCGGRACDSLRASKSCSQYINKDCQMGAWSAWSACDNGCGTGRARKTRKILQQPVCRGRTCGPVDAYKACTDYRNNRDCRVGQWSSWGRCDQTCAIGNKQRTRVITQNQQCRGNACPVLKESTQCGSPNNGCQHKCTNGVCSCNAGYHLNGTKKCLPKDCGKLTLTYCAPGTQRGTTCKYAGISCPNNQTTFPVTCSVVCPSTYALKGVSSVTCTAVGAWTSTTATYCRRINDPPTQILLSGTHSVPENNNRSTIVGVLTSVDPNPRNSHKYTLKSGGEGKFAIIGNTLYTTVVLDYEKMNKRYHLTVRSTDNGNPPLYMDKVITITLTDVNEKPTDIRLSNHQVAENSDIDTVVGLLSTTDQDTSQSFTYTLTQTASGRFKIVGNVLKVAISNGDCLKYGGLFCSLNYETQPNQWQIAVRSTDNGNPALSVDVNFTIGLTDVNDQPRGLSLSGNTVKENATKGEMIGKFSAQDEDRKQSIVFSLFDDDNGTFAVSSDGNLTKVLETDFEKKKKHSVTAVVKDDGNPIKQMKKSFVIEVLDVNEPPISIILSDQSGQLSFAQDHAHVNENSTSGTVIGILQAEDTDATQNLTFSLDINPLQAFALVPANCTHGNNTVCTAVMKVSGDLNYEVSPTLEIAVRVTDQHGSYKIQNFTISVVDNNDRPSNVTISGDLVASVAENSPRAFIGELVTSDEDLNQTHSYKILKNSDIFEIRNTRSLYLKATPLDFERRRKYVVTVTSTDNGSPQLTSAIQSFTIHVTDMNEAPSGITLSNAIVAENSASGTIIGNFSVEDPDNFGNFSSRQSHVCRLTDSAQGIFQILVRNRRNFLSQAISSLDYEQARKHKISVVCTDPYGLSNETSFNVIVSDVNEAPVKVTLSKTKILENLGPMTVGFFSTQDPDNANNQSKQSFRYSLRTVGSSPFVIVGNVLNTTRSLNYENAKSWRIVVRARDDGDPALYRDENFVINVIDDNDGPTAIQMSNLQVKENSDIGTVVGNLATSDEDVGQNHVYKLIDSAGGRFRIHGSLVKVAISNARCLQYGGTSCLLNYDVNPDYNITIRTTDNGNPAKSFDQTLTIHLNDDNDRPRDLRLTNYMVQENATLRTVIGTFTARDEDVGQNLTFSLANDDGGRFALMWNKLVTAKSLDHEADKRHVIAVVVTDNGYNALKLQRNFTIEVLNINEAPIAVNFTDTQSPAVLENTTTGSTVGTLLALDADANQDLKFKLDDDSGGEFSLQNSSVQCQTVAQDQNKTSCTVKLLLTKPLNYEVASKRFITVRVTDTQGLFRVERFSIKVIDCNDAPTNITLDGGVSAVVQENSDGAFVGELETSDEDSVQNWTYQLAHDFGKLFMVTGKYIYLTQGKHLDYERKSRYTLGVKAIDNRVPPYDISRNFTIVVTDINEAPTDINISSAKIFENSAPGTVIANLTVVDPDNDVTTRQRHSCVVIGRNKLAISHGRLVNRVALDFEDTQFVNVSIECTDDGTPRLKYQEDFTITVKDKNEAPSDIILSSLRVLENQGSGVIATISTIDPDNNNKDTRQVFSYQFVPVPNGDFPFRIQAGNLSTTRALNYESAASWNFTIQSRDSGLPPMTVLRTFVIYVQDVNELPSNITLSPKNIRENSEQDTLVGKLTVEDEDNGQSHRFTLLDSASGRFKLVNNSEIRVALSNTNCRLHGGKYCLLNYEGKKNVYPIVVRAMDDGTPPQQCTMGIDITLDDVNDQPRDLALSKHWVAENAPVNTSVGYFNASDEDDRQTLTYSLVRGGHGLFRVEANGRLFVAQPLNHENSSTAVLTVRANDDGVPSKHMEKSFTIVIKNTNEAPLNTSFKSIDGQQSYDDDQPKIYENSKVGTVVGTLVSLDQDAGQYLTFTLDDDAGGRFSINKTTINCHNSTSHHAIKTKCSCKLLVSGNLNFEDAPSHDVIVRVSDGNHSLVSDFTITVVDRNDAPDNVTIQGSLSGRVKENMNDELIGELVTSDEDGSQSHVYALKGKTKFTVKGSKLYTSPDANLNYEEQQGFEVAVVSTDNGRPPKSVERNVTIEVEDVNETPTNMTLSDTSVDENSQPGTFVANITIDDPDNHGPKGTWQTHSCQLIDSAQDRFKIANNTNTLLVSSGKLNYEESRRHRIIIQCTDSAVRPLSLQMSFEIQVLDVNERPEQIMLSNQEVPENGGPLFVGDLSTLDPDKAQSFKYSLVSTDEVFYIGNVTKVMTNASLNYEEKSSWLLTIETTDQDGLSLTQNFTISVRDVNDPPTDILPSRPLAISENSVAGSSVAIFTAVDEDAGQTHRFFITSVTAFGYGYNRTRGYQTTFHLDSTSGRLTVASHIDYETVTKFSVGIMTQDSGYPQFTLNKTFTLEVVDINEPPSDLQLDNSQIAENSEEGSLVGNLSVSDPDNINGDRQFYVCAVLNDVPFKVVKMRLVAKAILDFETRSYYSVKINCSQIGNATFYIYRTFQVDVTDVNEAPYNLRIVNGTSVKENLAKGTFVGTLFAEDYDRNNNVTFELAENAGDASKFSINGSSLLTSAVFNYEEKSCYLITVAAKDDGVPSMNETKRFNITVIDVNDAPSNITFSSSGVEENAIKGTLVGTFETDDEDKGQSHQYTLLNYQLTFYVSDSKLLVKESGRLDYENKTEIEILVRTTDNGSPPKSRQEYKTVKILNANDRPYDIIAKNLSIDENTQGNTPVTFEVRDQDVGQTHRCFVQDSMFFDINGTSNHFILRVKNEAVIDYERNSTIKITVNCTDNGVPPLSISKSFHITINDVNEAPTDIILNGAHELDEIVPVGYTLGYLDCIDPDRNQKFSFQVIGEFSDTFNIAKGTNLLTVISNTKLDYERLDSPVINVTIHATDDGIPAQSCVKNLSITVNEINEGMNKIYLKPDDIVLKETTAVGTNISELVCNNPELWQALDYDLISHETFFKVVKVPFNASFNPPILNKNGRKQSTFEQFKSFLVVNSTFLNYNERSRYDILVNVTDDGVPPKSFRGNVFVNVSRVDPCLPVNNCSSNANCTRIDGFIYYCTCLDGFEGDGYNCTGINDCLPAIKYCGDNGTNGTMNETGGSTEQESKSLARICPACKNNATCTDHHLTFSCKCLPGFNGTQCGHNIDECDSRNFNHSCSEEHGVCIDGVNNISCSCDRGFTDWLCRTNIDDCALEPCGDHGNCADHIGSYECKCERGYTGTRCERTVGSGGENCLDGQRYVSFPLEQTPEEKDNKEPREKENGSPDPEISSQDVCFSGDDITTLYFDKELLTTLKRGKVGELREDVIAAIKIELEDWFKKNMRIYYSYTNHFNEDGDFNLTDISILDDITINSDNISVSMIARVGRKAISSDGVLCALNDTDLKRFCLNKISYPDFTSKDFRFRDYLCPTITDTKKQTIKCQNREAVTDALTGNDSKKLPQWSVYLLASVGAALLVFVVGFACYADRSQKLNLQQALRNRQQYDHVRLPEEDDEHYRDVMFRHHRATTMSKEDGEGNPMYGLDQENDESEMIANPLYGMSRGLESPPTSHARAFTNPLYGTMEREPGLRAKPVGKDDLNY